MQKIVLLHRASEFVEPAQRRWDVQPGNRSSQQRGNVGMLVVFGLVHRLSHNFVRTGAFSLGSCNQEIVAMNGERAGVPVGGDEA